MPGPTQRTKAEQARHFLTHGGVAREDSDDELGLEDLPWIWIYETEKGYESEEDAPSEDGQLDNSRRKRKRKSQRKRKEGEIVGAKMGNFECRIGDCVLLKAEGNKEAWVGLICDFCEEDGEKAANFMWFSSEKEIVNNRKKRKDFMQVWFLVYVEDPSFVLSMTNRCKERAIHHSIMGRKCPVRHQWQSFDRFGRNVS